MTVLLASWVTGGRPGRWFGSSTEVPRGGAASVLAELGEGARESRHSRVTQLVPSGIGKDPKSSSSYFDLRFERKSGPCIACSLTDVLFTRTRKG